MRNSVVSITKRLKWKSSCSRFASFFVSTLAFLVVAAVPAMVFAQSTSISTEVTGEASVEVADYFEAGIAEYRYFIIEPEAKKNNSSNTNKKPKKIRTEIFFKGKPHEKFQTGKKLKVRGKKRANGRDIDFESLEELEPEPGTKSEPASRTMSAAAPKAEAPVATPETRKILTILMDFTDALVDNGGSNGVSLQEAKNIMFHNPRNVSHFYDLASLGTLTIPADPNSTGGDAVYGPYLINDTYLPVPAITTPGAWLR